MAETARVQAIYRYPVKGFSPEPLDRTTLRAGQTVPNDRRYAVDPNFYERRRHPDGRLDRSGVDELDQYGEYGDLRGLRNVLRIDSERLTFGCDYGDGGLFGGHLVDFARHDRSQRRERHDRRRPFGRRRK